MQDLPIRFSIVYDAYAAGLTWLAGNGSSAEPDPNAISGINLGNGTELSAVDVVDSHFERLINANPRDDRQDASSANGANPTDSDADTTINRVEARAHGGHDGPLDADPLDAGATNISTTDVTGSVPALDNLGQNDLGLHGDQEQPAPPESAHPKSALSESVDAGETAPKRSLASLHQAVGSLAPHLLPLLQVAEEIVAENPPVAPPKREYRTLLNAALIAEHKQQMNKQAIGIEIPAEEADLLEKVVENKYTLMASLPVAMTLALSLWYVRRSRRAEPTEEE